MRYCYESGDSLQHYGIKGQKWGIRRYQEEDGTLTEEGKERYSKSDSIKKKIDEAADSVSDYVKRKVGVTVEKHKDPSMLTDDELNNRLIRMRKESEYMRLKREIDGTTNQNGKNQGKNGSKKHPYLALALLTPLATAIGVGTKAITSEKVAGFIEDRAKRKADDLASATSRGLGKKVLDKLTESAKRAAETASKFQI